MNGSTALHRTIAGLIILGSLTVSAATRYVWPGSPNPAPPYADWGQAAHVIQEAVDASAAGDEIVVTNGVYATGGRAVYGTMTNRVAVDRAVTLRSVNGPEVTVIRGYQVPGVTNGDGAVRCVYLTNGTVLSGFTLTNGATRGSGDLSAQRSGGGLWYESSNAIATNCILIGNAASDSGGGAYSGMLHTCILTGNCAFASGGGVSECALDSCTLTGNLAYSGGGASYGTLYGCLLSGNSALSGGGACQSALDDCTLAGNSAQVYGGGAYYGRLTGCTLTSNSVALYGGGACNGTLDNCAVTGNSAREGGGAYALDLNNCTLTGNSASSSGGGASACTLNNCIVFYNAAGTDPNHTASTLNYCCTTPFPGGEGNITDEPMLASASHLGAESPCRGAGNAAYATGTDIDGDAWLNPPSMGCDEYRSGSVQGTLRVEARALWTDVAVSFAVNLTGSISGAPAASVWDFGDGTVLSNRPYTSHRWTAPGEYAVVLRAYNDSNPGGVSATVTVRVLGQQVYVAAASTNPVAPFSSWATAAQTIQEAVDAAAPGCLILVSNGVYASGGRMVYGGMSNRVAVYKPLEVRSLSGPSQTVIQGYQVPGTTNGDSAIRCVYLTNGAVLNGFTLTDGATRCSGDVSKEQRGGGLWCESSTVATTNCILTGNAASDAGGGVYSGALYACSLVGNWAPYGGGASRSSLTRCTITGNSAGSGGGAYDASLISCALSGNLATGGGGGAFNCELDHCDVFGNSAQAGGGAYWGKLTRCILTSNSVALYGGGACSGTLDNCAVTANSALRGGGGHSLTLNNCTVTGNSAWSSGGGVSDCTINNSIIYYNRTTTGDNYAKSTLNYCCTTPLPADGEGNITNEPALVSASHLSGESACRGAGNTACAEGVDIDGDAWLSPPSMGCDEYRAASLTGGLAVAVGADWTNVAVGFPVNLTGSISGAAAASVWAFGDGLVLSNRPYVSHHWSAPGDYTVQFCAYNESNPEGVSVTVHVRVVAQTVHYVSLGSSNPVAPYASWATAAHTIQEAVEIAAPGGLVLVTNGIYSTGGKAACGLNRLAVDKPLEVRSVNGPSDTVIQGCRVSGGTNREEAIRCAYLSQWAVLSGFTLANGGTGTSGGGLCCESTNAVATNCILSGNAASDSGGGACSGTLYDCTIAENSATYGGGVRDSVLNRCSLTSNSVAVHGGGAYNSWLIRCMITGNSATECGGGTCYGKIENCMVNGNSASQGGAAYLAALNNCTLTGNSASNSGGGVSVCTVNNCIVYYNTAAYEANYNASTLNYCCTTPQASEWGGGNITNEPALASASHLSAESPCRGAGSSAYTTGVDIDGDSWHSPPSMGCDEYQAITTGALAVAASADRTYVGFGFAVNLTGRITGAATASVWNFADGVVLSNRLYASHSWAAPGDYMVVLRAYNESNPGGVSATVSVRVATRPVHYVAADSVNPVAPYATWTTAARTIQEAVDAAVSGSLVLVGNGVYASGGRAVHGSMTNRVAVDKSVEVRSVNGPAATVIQGREVPGMTNGDGAIRCVYLADGAALSGFTLTNGATRASGDVITEQRGGALWCESASVIASNCILTGNAASDSGGGVYSGALYNCRLSENSAVAGGGACGSALKNCILSRNSAYAHGGGAYNGSLDNCAILENSANEGGGAFGATLSNSTLTGNSASDSGGGVSACILNNCIVYYNQATNGANYNASALNYCCTTPEPSDGEGNIANEPALASPSHLSALSPCRGAGNSAFASGVDIDGEAWLSPPSMGCDEYRTGALTGDLTVAIDAGWPYVSAGSALDLATCITGAATASVWNFGDGVVLSNCPYASHSWVAPGDYAVVLRAYNESNPGGVSATVTVRVLKQTVHYVAAASANPTVPYTSWATAARTIQDAVDASSAGDEVVVTNGVYATGGRTVHGATMNRAAVDRAITLRSVSGPSVTVIQGYQVPGTTNGDGAVRCVYLTDGAVLDGFTLTNGAIRFPSWSPDWGCGGALLCESTKAFASNCILAGNSAYCGGAVYSGTLNDCLLIGNSAMFWGGGAHESVLNNCTVVGNSAHYGGAGSSGALNNCTIIGNSAAYGGGADSSILTNCTLTLNSASSSGGGAWACTLNNCIVYYNTASAGANCDFCELLFSCTTPLPQGEGNIDSDPLFVDLAGGNLRLRSDSPCVNAGNNDYIAAAVDLDGNPRVVGDIVDMGAYEFQLNPALTPVLRTLPLDATGAFQLQVTGIQRPGAFVLEVSTNLSTWQPVLTNTTSATTLDYTDDAARSLQCQFYRGRQR